MIQNADKYLSTYFLENNEVDLDREPEIFNISAEELIGSNRFDLLAKWIYIDAREKNVDLEWAKQVYYENINAFSCGTFIEPGSSEKVSFEKYLSVFDQLIDDIKVNGFDRTKSLIPIGKNNVLLDGAHRTTIAAYYHKVVTVIKFPNLDRNYDYKFFRKFLMQDIHMGYMAMYYASIKKRCYMACLWPAADQTKVALAEKELLKIGNIVYSQDVYLNYNGMKNLMIQLYGHQRWTGTIEDKFKGVDSKVNPCFRKGKPIKTYLFEAESLEQVVDAKQKIREIFQIENHSIHISDNQVETKDMVELLYNPNSVRIMNVAVLFRDKRVYLAQQKIKDDIEAIGCDRSRFVLIGQAVLKICGIGRCAKPMFLSDETSEKIALLERRTNCVFELENATEEKKNLLYNPENYFFMNGMKVLTLKNVCRLLEEERKEKRFWKHILCVMFEWWAKQCSKVPNQKKNAMIREYQIDKKIYGKGVYPLEDYWKIRFWQWKDKLKRGLGIKTR